MQVRILGPLEVSDDGRVVELGAGRQRALLALLAVHAREIVATDRLIEELWGSSPPPTASKALQNLVSQLRRTMGADAIITRSPGYGIQLEGDDLDASHFERLAAEGRRVLDDDPSTAARTLRAALELWRGPALVEFAYESFAQGEIARLEELRLWAIEDRIDADLAVGGGAQLVPELEALVSSNPLRERLRGQLMLALYRSGRQAEALEAYREGRSALSDGLGLEPGAPLRELEQAILNQDPALGPIRTLRPPAQTRRRRRLALTLGVVVLLAIVLAVALAARGGDAPPPVPNSLVKIDAETNEIVDVIPVGRTPGEVAVVGDYVVVSSEEDATLTRVDIRTGETTTSGASGADQGLAVAGDKYVWVVSRQRHRVTRVDVESLQLLDHVELEPDLAYVFAAVGGRSLWISQFGQPAVLRYGLPTLQLERRYDYPVYQVLVEVAYGYGAAWVVLGDSRALLRIDARTGETMTVPTGSTPGPPTAGFGSMWSTSIDEGTLWRVDGLTGDARVVLDVGRGPFGAATGAGSVWVANNCDGTVDRVDPESEEVVATVRTGYFPLDLTVGGGYVWVALRAEGWDPGICN
jgi:DNA-binding SARP family transcriptional activator/streptogramin lyase